MKPSERGRVGDNVASGALEVSIRRIAGQKVANLERRKQSGSARAREKSLAVQNGPDTSSALVRGLS